jgi:hypothetical protein
MGAARLTQQAVESLQQGASTARLTQQTVELLVQGTPGARISQQAVEVLIQTGNWARLTQQAIEILCKAPFVRSATDTLTITESDDSDIIPGGPAPVDREGEDTLTITETDVIQFVYTRACADSITITETDSSTVSSTFGYEDEITITETDEILLIPNYSVEDELAITETYSRVVTFEREAIDYIGFAETNLRRYTYTREAEDTLVPTDKAFGERHDEGQTDTIVITESTLSTRVLSRSASDTITIVETVTTPRVLERSAIDTLTILEPTVPRYVEGIQFSVPAFIGIVISSSLYDSCENVNQPHCILSGMHYTVALPNPIFGDGEANTDQLRVFRTTTNRRVITVKRQQLKTLNYTFRLTRKKAIELRNLIKAEIDNQVTWRNWKGEMWVGTIGTNPFTVQADGRWGPCTEGMTVELELKAVRVI